MHVPVETKVFVCTQYSGVYILSFCFLLLLMSVFFCSPNALLSLPQTQMRITLNVYVLSVIFFCLFYLGFKCYLISVFEYAWRIFLHLS